MNPSAAAAIRSCAQATACSSGPTSSGSRSGRVLCSYPGVAVAHQPHDRLAGEDEGGPAVAVGVEPDRAEGEWRGGALGLGSGAAALAAAVAAAAFQVGQDPGWGLLHRGRDWMLVVGKLLLAVDTALAWRAKRRFLAEFKQQENDEGRLQA